MITTIITFIIIFGILVTFHEFGHFIMAKRSGILVREFAIGMGPKIVDIKRNGTTYTLRILPVGGYVRLAGLDESLDDLQKGTFATLSTDEDERVIKINVSNDITDSTGVPIEVVNFDLEDQLFIEGYINGDEQQLKRFTVDHDATIVEKNGTEIKIAPKDVQFQSASVLNKILTNIAGPFNNFVLAIIVFSLVGILQGSVPKNNNQIEVIPNGVAAKAGLKNNDIILKVNNNKTKTWSDLSKQISKNPNKQIRLSIKRGSQIKNYNMVPKSFNHGKTGMIQIEVAQNKNVFSRLLYGFTGTWTLFTQLIIALKHLFENFSLNQLGGPVAMYSVTSQATHQGFISVLNMLGFLSLNLGVVNLLPIPALDGGKILLNIIEGIRRKPLNSRSETIVTVLSFGILILLMILVTWNDVQRYFIK